MRRVGPRSIALAGAAAAILASCGGGHGSSTSTTAPTSVASSSTGAARSTVPRSTAPVSTVPATVSAGPTTTTRSSASLPPASAPGSTASVRITGVRVMPSSPVSCDAPSMIELQWTSAGATTVTLSIDGRAFATYGSGPQDHLEYFACDGRPHTYTLHAVGNGSSATVTRTVTSR